MRERIDLNIAPSAAKSAILTAIALALVLPVSIGCLQPASTATPIQTPTATPAPTTPPKPTTRLQLAMSWVPVGYADKLLEFSDHASSALATGVPIPHSIEEYGKIYDIQRSRLFEGTAGDHPRLGSALTYMEESFNYSVWEYDLAVWNEFHGGREPQFMIFEGISDVDGMMRGLAEQGFEETDYNGTPYWRIYEDYRYDIKRHPIRILTSKWNRVALMDNRILAAPATPVIENLIDVQKGESTSLLESPTHLSLARALGKGMIGGIFATPERIAYYATGNFRLQMLVGNVQWSEFDHKALDMHLTGPEAWGKLSPYSVALFGYRVQDDVEETVIALHYFDPDAARRDAGELEKRWNSFHLFVQYGVPVTDSCAPLSIKIEEAEESCILLATCPVIRGTEEHDAFVRGPDLWIELYFDGGKLEFLALDLEEQKRLAKERAK